jgi:hypothetical protein
MVTGIFREMTERMRARGGYSSPREWAAFDAEAFKLAADELCAEAGVRVRLHTLVTKVAVRAGRITRVATESKSGRESWTAGVYIDCTGDADLAYMAGVPCDYGRAEDGNAQPMTLNFRLARVEVERMPPRREINARYDRAKAEGRVHCPRENVLFFYTPQPDVVHFNTTRVVGCKGTDAADLTQAEQEARRQVRELVDFLRTEVAGFEQAYLQQTATQIGIRETRRIHGAYTLTADDVVTARKFEDGIARCSYPIDIHSPTGSGTDIRSVPRGDYYQIPYRCLQPLGVENLLVAGRCVSATHEGQSSLRVMPQCFAMGQAAGAAAALAIRGKVTPAEAPLKDLQRILDEQGQVY